MENYTYAKDGVTTRFWAEDGKRKKEIKSLRRHSPQQRAFLVMIAAAIVLLFVLVPFVDRLIPTEIQVVGPAQYSNSAVQRYVMVACMLLLFGGTPLMYLLKKRTEVVDGVLKRRGEEIYLTESMLLNTYHYNEHRDFRRFSQRRYCCSIMLYQDIERIELYEQEQALKVYGKVYFCKGPGSLQMENVVRVLDKPSQAYRVFFLYYHDSDRFVQLLAERAGKPVDRMNVCTTSLQEVKNKGVF